MASTLPWTILRPGGLTDQPGTGRVQLGPHAPFGDIPRADVAATAVAVLASPASVGHAWGLVSGTAPVTEAAGHPSPSGSMHRWFPAVVTESPISVSKKAI
jgi:hypothetical protein